QDRRGGGPSRPVRAMAVTFDELLERARKRVAEVSPARQGIPTSPAVPELHRTQFRGRPVEAPLRPDSEVDVDFAIARASEAVQRLDRPLRTLGVGGGQPTSPEDRPKPDVAGFLASIARPEAVVEIEDQRVLERSGLRIAENYCDIGS